MILRTGGGEVRQSLQAGAWTPGFSGDPRLLFDVGFETDEVIGPGIIFDSFTVTADAGEGLAAILLTIDGFGLAVAPTAPGAVRIDPSAVAVVPRSAPDLGGHLSRVFAYSVDAALPAGFLESALDVRFELFDNRNGIDSQGWLANLTVIPEPSGLGLLLWGMSLYSIIRRKCKM